MDDNARLSDYEHSANDYTRWCRSADILILSAQNLDNEYYEAENALKADPTISTMPDPLLFLPHIIYLRASALEQYLKALFIKNGNTITDGNGAISKIMLSHNLIELCNNASFIYNSYGSEATLLLNKLTDCLHYWGRYPVPKNFHFWRKNIAGIKGIMPTYSWSKDEDKLLLQLISDVKIRLV